MRIRNMITLTLIPINSYAHASSKQDVLKKYYKSIICLRDSEEEIKKIRTHFK